MNDLRDLHLTGNTKKKNFVLQIDTELHKLLYRGTEKQTKTHFYFLFSYTNMPPEMNGPISKLGAC